MVSLIVVKVSVLCFFFFCFEKGGSVWFVVPCCDGLFEKGEEKEWFVWGGERLKIFIFFLRELKISCSLLTCLWKVDYWFGAFLFFFIVGCSYVIKDLRIGKGMVYMLISKQLRFNGWHAFNLWVGYAWCRLMNAGFWW